MSPIITIVILAAIILAGIFFFKSSKCQSSDNYPTRIKNSLKVLSKLYEDVNGTEISLAERQRLQTEDSSFTYGEITFPSVAASLAIAEPKSGEVFYDLGSGAGKAVFSAALLNNWKKCVGVEFLPGLHECTTKLLEKLKDMPDARKFFNDSLNNIQFIQGDMLKTDFSDADIVYMNATAFSSDLWDSLVPKLETLKKGARIIVLTKRLNKDKFSLIQETSLPMSWGMNSVMVYKRI